MDLSISHNELTMHWFYRSVQNVLAIMRNGSLYGACTQNQFSLRKICSNKIKLGQQYCRSIGSLLSNTFVNVGWCIFLWLIRANDKWEKITTENIKGAVFHGWKCRYHTSKQLKVICTVVTVPLLRWMKICRAFLRDSVEISNKISNCVASFAPFMSHFLFI